MIDKKIYSFKSDKKISNKFRQIKKSQFVFIFLTHILVYHHRQNLSVRPLGYLKLRQVTIEFESN